MVVGAYADDMRIHSQDKNNFEQNLNNLCKVFQETLPNIIL